MYPVLLGPEAAGLKVARTIYKPGTNIPWLRVGATLNVSYIQSLLSRGISTVYVQNPFVQVDVPEVVPEVTRRQAVLTLEKAVSNIQGDPRYVKEVTTVITEMIRLLPDNSDHLWNLASLRSRDNYTFEHSVNTAVIAMMIGKRIHYSEGDLRGLGLGAILHDLGKVFIPLEILNKPGKLDADEWKIMKTHSRQGYDVLSRQWEISYLSSHCALQHHERLDGTGYPRGLKGTEIHEWAVITAVADVFDALTAERAYKKAQPPHEALAYLRAYPGQYDVRIVDILSSIVAPYQTGSWVRLSDNRIAVVMAQHPDAPRQPSVAIVANALHSRVPIQEIDLRGNTLEISEVLERPPVIMEHAT